MRLPTEEEIENERTTSWSNQSGPNQSEAVRDMIDRKMDMGIAPRQAANEGVSPEYLNNFPYLVINEEHILAAAKKAKRLTAGGLQ